MLNSCLYTDLNNVQQTSTDTKDNLSHHQLRSAGINVSVSEHETTTDNFDADTSHYNPLVVTSVSDCKGNNET